MTKSYSIGIDLGTTYSCVGVYKNSHVEIIANDHGKRVTPSYVSFFNNERLVGDNALYKCGTNPKNTIFGVKRLIGRNFNDNSVQSDIKYWPFTVIEKDGRPYIQVEYKGETKQFAAEEISAMVLSKMKKTAEEYLNQDIIDAVITVPAYFNDSQRRATIDAGTIAGLNVLRIINEPTSAALAYGLNNEIKKKENILVVDLGGGTYDVSLLNIEDGTFKVKGISGDTHFGGEDINNRLVDYFVKEIKEKYHKDISTNQRSLSRLRQACERAKRTLSSSYEAQVEIECLFGEDDFYSSITRSCFEEINSSLFDKLIGPIKSVIIDAKISKSDVSEIVLVGGSTRIPKVQSIISSFFKGKELKKTINPDEAVAYGAAVEAAILSGDIKSDIVLLDVTPLSLGVRTREDDMSTIIERNSTIPVTKSDIYWNRYDNQTIIKFDIHEGERLIASKNNLLDSLSLYGVTPAPRGETKVEVTFEIDNNGILSVTAREIKTNLSKKINVKNEKGRLNRYDIIRMIKEAEENKENDEKEKERLQSLYDLEDYAYSLRKSLQEKNNSNIIGLNSYNTIRITKAINNTLEWLKNNKNSPKEDFDKKKFELKLISLNK